MLSYIVGHFFCISCHFFCISCHFFPYNFYNLLVYLLIRQRLQDEYFKQVNVVFQQWESDIEKTKEQETKLTVSLF